jgi:hypothetical protein
MNAPITPEEYRVLEWGMLFLKHNLMHTRPYIDFAVKHSTLFCDDRRSQIEVALAVLRVKHGVRL